MSEHRDTSKLVKKDLGHLDTFALLCGSIETGIFEQSCQSSASRISELKESYALSLNALERY